MDNILVHPFRWVAKTLETQADLVTNLLFPSPSSRRQHYCSTPTRFSQTQPPPQPLLSTLLTLIKKLCYGLMGAAYSCMVLAAALVVAVMIGVWLVNLWVEEPVVIREKLYFDYTEPNPTALFDLTTGQTPPSTWWLGKTKTKRSGRGGVPVGHTYTVSVILLMPESDLNLENGVFQLTVEVLSQNGGEVMIARSSKPCMLHYRSRPIRLARTLILCLPILLGLTHETQRLVIETVRYTEATSPRSGYVTLTLSSRAGAVLHLPQVYEAEILVQSRLPWRKEVIRDWKWTFYVWSVMWSYLMIIALLVCCFRNFLFRGCGGVMREEGVGLGLDWSDESGGGGQEVVEEEEEEEVDSGKLRKWQSYRRKRKADLLGQTGVVISSTTYNEVVVESEAVSSSATSYTVDGADESGGGGGDVPLSAPVDSTGDDDDDETVIDGRSVGASTSSSSVSSMRRRRSQPGVV